MRQSERRAPTLWVDITELFGQFSLVHYPTGISRVMINLCDALAADRGALFGSVRPVFWHPVWRRPLAVDGAGLGTLATFFPALKEKYKSSGWTPPVLHSGIKKGLITAIPKPLRFRCFPYLNGITHFLGWAPQAGLHVSPIELAPCDCLFVPGSFWLDDYAPRFGGVARATGAAVVGFVHDVLLVSHPEWMAPHHSRQFRRGVEDFLPHCTALVCNSVSTREELRKHFSLAQKLPTAVCRLADSPQVLPSAHVPATVKKLVGQRYALFVSTMIPRKNHRLAIAAWRKLWSMLGESTPWLVLVGGGAPDPAVAEMLSQPASFGGRVIRLTGVDDATLEALYANAWITLYPSLGEGYGLPVAEALARGKACIATRCGGLEEVASDLVDTIGPDDPDELVQRIAEYLANPGLLTAREQLIRMRYRPTRWEDTARTVRDVLEGAVDTMHGVRPGA
jgi:glycosyltransferase involved in cell wall biosynthesis